jgi:class 3 adenylate cyclase
MEPFSGPCEVLISYTVAEQIKNRSLIETVSLSKFRSKHVKRPFEIFAVSAAGLAVSELLANRPLAAILETTFA